MPRRETGEGIEFDYYRQLVRRPPRRRSPAAHLAWVRMMTKILIGLEQWVPLFTTALCAKERSIEVFRPFCEGGHFERSYLEQVPHQLLFLEHFIRESESQWLKDLGRTELWFNSLRGQAPAQLHDRIREIVGLQKSNGKEFIVVSHDPLETFQSLIAFQEMSLSRAGRLLWFLGVAPVYPWLEPQYKTGIVVFLQNDGEPGMTYLPAT